MGILLPWSWPLSPAILSGCGSRLQQKEIRWNFSFSLLPSMVTDDSWALVLAPRIVPVFMELVGWGAWLECSSALYGAELAWMNGGG